METLMEVAALFGKPEYDEKSDNGSLWDTVLWAINSINQ